MSHLYATYKLRARGDHYLPMGQAKVQVVHSIKLLGDGLTISFFLRVLTSSGIFFPRARLWLAILGFKPE